MNIVLNPRCVDDYRKFKRIKQLPAWQIRGRLASFPDEYADRLGLSPVVAKASYQPEPFLFDYQADITRMAVDNEHAILPIAGWKIAHAAELRSPRANC